MGWYQYDPVKQCRVSFILSKLSDVAMYWRPGLQTCYYAFGDPLPILYENRTTVFPTTSKPVSLATRRPRRPPSDGQQRRELEAIMTSRIFEQGAPQSVNLLDLLIAKPETMSGRSAWLQTAKK